MSARSDVLLWAHRTIARKGGPAHTLLDLDENSTAAQVQEAFHKIARTAHPDLHRNALTPDELELVTRAYSTVAAAYMVMRSMAAQTQEAATPEPRGSEPRVTVPPNIGRAAAATPVTGARITQPPPQTASAPSAPEIADDVDPAHAMSAKALPYFRKAEVCLKRGDLKGAVLQLKLALNTDPSSAFLRTLLADTEAMYRSSS